MWPSSGLVHLNLFILRSPMKPTCINIERRKNCLSKAKKNRLFSSFHSSRKKNSVYKRAINQVITSRPSNAMMIVCMVFVFLCGTCLFKHKRKEKRVEKKK